MSPIDPFPRDQATTGPADALKMLVARAGAEGPPLIVVKEGLVGEPAFGLMAAAGPRTSSRGSVHAFVVEAVREGYLCHNETSRVLESPDLDLALLAGDLFYAIGISALAELGDDESIRLLSDLIVVSAELRSVGRRDDAEAFWVARTLALACGADAEHWALSESLMSAGDRSARDLDAWSDRTAATHGITRHIDEVRHLIHFTQSP